ncbi:hypothetical protein MY11210_002362 [Beauveria gryllotalpidicola]
MFRKILPDKARVNTGYGTTEVAGLSSGIIDDNWVTGCVGQVPSSTAVKIVYFDTLQEVPPGAVGEVCARSAAAFSGYYNSAAATERAFLPGEPGWFRTGDKGVMDPESRVLTLLGRFKEIFKVRCKEVAPAEVECVFLQNGDITDALIVDFVASKLAAHKAPTGGVLFCDEIPRGTMGKPLKSELGKVVPLPESARFLAPPNG